MSKQLLHAVTRGLWALDPMYAQSNLPFVEGFLRGDKNNFDFKNDAYVKGNSLPRLFCGGQTIFVDNDTWYGKDQIHQAPYGSIIVIPVTGPIMKEDHCYSPGTMTLARWIAMADANDNIQSIIIEVDSPGGQVDGTQSLADAIRACSKKTIGYVSDGMAASAGYWILSACDEIVSSHKTNNIGSIGVFVQLANFAKYYKEAVKLEIHTIYADQSTEKNLPVRNVMEGGENSEALIKAEMLNPIAEAFINAVKVNRGEKLNLSEGNPFLGKLYMSEEALKIGLIDRIEKLEQVITGLSSSGTPTKKAEIQLNQKPEMKKLSLSAAWVGLLAFFSASVAAGNETVEVEADEGKMNELLAKAELSINLEAKVQELNEKLTASENLAAERLSTIEGLSAKVEELKAKPGAGPHQPVKEKPDADPNAQEESPILSDVDAEARQAWAESQPN